MADKAISKVIPDGRTFLRAAVTSIPAVGGALDHLLFDKADTIRLENIETSLKALAGRIQEVAEASIDKSWFQSEEALAAIRMLSDKVAFEADKQKIKDLGRATAACGLVAQSKDPRKLSVLEHISRLSPVQLRLMRILANTPPRVKKLSKGGLEQTFTAIWPEDIKAALEKGPSFWDGTLDLSLELEVLESLNAICRVPVIVSGDLAYMLTGLGRKSASMIEMANL